MNQLKKAKRKAQQKQKEQLPPMADSTDSPDAEPEPKPKKEETESASEIAEATEYFKTGYLPTTCFKDVYCCCFDCGIEGTYQ